MRKRLTLILTVAMLCPAASHAQTADSVALKAGRTLSEVVVTALGITRKERSLGYSATTLSGDELASSRTTSVADALAGKAAGVQVFATSADPGAATNVVIRGFSSINGTNQPLYVVDGVPLQNSMVSALGLNIAAAGISNIASADIESLTILRGAAATALYGSRAAGGVIVITTKKGRKGEGRNFTLSYSGTLQARTVSLLPEMQDAFGQGWKGRQTYVENGSWGPAFDGSQQVYGPVWNKQQLIHAYSAAGDNVKDFFETGLMQSHSLSIGGASADDRLTYYLSYSYTGDDGIMPSGNDKYLRHTLAFRHTYEASRWLKVSSALRLARTSTDAVPTYQGTSVIEGLYEAPRDVSFVDKKDLSVAFNTPEAYFTPYQVTNPYWALENNYFHTDAKQLGGKVQADLTPLSHLTLTYRLGFDYSDYDTKMGRAQIELDDAYIEQDYGGAPSQYMNKAGYVYANYARRYELNHDFLARYSRPLLSGRLHLDALAGLNVNERSYTRLTGQTSDLTFASGFWDLSNGSTKTTLSEGQQKRRLVGLFADVTLGWDDMLFLGLTARNDWSSTLPKAHNSFFYPGATLAWVFTGLLPKNPILSFGKLRLAYGMTGNDASAYSTASTYSQTSLSGRYATGILKFPVGGVNSYSLSATKGGATLKPEMTRELELGLNLQLLRGRIGLDAAFYNRTTDDQIFALPLDPSTGHSYEWANFGSVRNRGIELAVSATPVRTRHFRWTLGLNFAKNWNKVLSLPANLDDGLIAIYPYTTGSKAVYLYAEQGKPLGQFYTYLPQHTADGRPIVDASGQPVLGTTVEDTGKNIQADWTGGLTTALTYKGVTLSAALDIRKGGYMFSRTKNLMQFTGNGAATTYNSRRPFVIPHSVVATTDAAGHTAYVENTTPLYLYDGSYQDYYDDYGQGLGGESFLLDRSFVKLRHVSLSWQLPRKWVSAAGLSDVQLSVFCHNVLTWTASSNSFIDPECTTVLQNSYGDLATQFGELYANPSCRTFGCSLSVKF